MAKAAWCTVAPTTGTGNKSISISAGAHTGRSDRSTTVTVQNQNGTKPDKSIGITQSKADLFITKVSGSFPSPIPSTGQILTITGTSNAESIRFTEDSDLMAITSFKVNGAAKTPISGDNVTPVYKMTEGADVKYSFEAVITIPANSYASSRGINIGVGAFTSGVSGEDSFVVDGTQVGMNSTISTDKASLSLVAAGTAQNIAITSNDNWTIS